MALNESLADFLAQGGKIKRVDLFIATDPKGNVLARNLRAFGPMKNI